MANPGTSVEPLPADLAERYGLPPFDRIEPLGGGHHNMLLRAGDVVIRIEDRSPESVAWEHELVGFLAAAIPEVLAPLAALDGSTYLVHDGRVLSLLPLVEGVHDGVFPPELLARIHRRGLEWPTSEHRPDRPSYRDLDWERNDWWDWSVVPRTPELVRAFERARAWVRSDPPLVRGPVHGDLARQNVLWRVGRVRAVLDWEYARLDWLALELTNAAWTFSHRDVDGFVRAYREAGGPAETDVLAEGILIRVLANALYLLTAKAQGRPYNPQLVDYLLATLREIA